MTDEFSFRSKDDELAELSLQLGEIRDALRGMQAKLNGIERHVKRAFPNLPERPASSRKRVGSSKTMTAEEALRLFEGMAAELREDNADAVERRLRSLSVEELRVIAHELGLPASNKPPRQQLQAAISGRLRESVLLSKGMRTEHQVGDEARRPE